MQFRIDAAEATKLPAIRNLNVSGWLAKWASIPGSKRTLYSTALASDDQSVLKAILASSLEKAALAEWNKANPSLPPVPDSQSRRVTDAALRLAPTDAANDSFQNGSPTLSSRPAPAFTEILDATKPAEPPIFELLTDRRAIAKRALELAAEHYPALSARLRKEGFTVPDTMPDTRGAEDYFGYYRMTLALDDNAVLLRTAIQLNQTASTEVTAWTILLAFVFKDEMLTTLRTWQHAALDGIPIRVFWLVICQRKMGGLPSLSLKQSDLFA